MENEFLKVEYGCPASNFTQEMTPWNTEFNKALNELAQEWTIVIANTIEVGKEKGIIRKDINAKEVTIFVLSGYWGIRNLGKLENSKKVYFTYLKQLKNYLDSLR